MIVRRVLYMPPPRLWRSSLLCKMAGSDSPNNPNNYNSSNGGNPSSGVNSPPHLYNLDNRHGASHRSHNSRHGASQCRLSLHNRLSSNRDGANKFHSSQFRNRVGTSNLYNHPSSHSNSRDGASRFL